MAEYFRDAYDFSQIFKTTYLGKLYKLNNSTLQWDDVTEVIYFSNDWDNVPEFLVNAYCLKLYSTLSAKYFSEHKDQLELENIYNFEFGTKFDYYYIDKNVFAVDEKQDLYICQPEVMVPQGVKLNTVPEEWHKFEYTEAYEVIKYQGCIIISDMELYFDNDGNVQGFTKDLKQFCLNLKTGQLNEVYDDIGVDPDWKECSIDNPIFHSGKVEVMLTPEIYKSLTLLHEYLVRSEKEYNNFPQDIPFGKEFTYFINPFGRVIAKDENNHYYNCDYDYMKPAYNRDSNEDCYEILRYNVMAQIEDYERYLEALPTLKMTMLHTINFMSNDDKEIIYSRDQKGNWYELNKATGELMLLDEEPNIGDDWLVLDKLQSLIMHGIYSSQNRY